MDPHELLDELCRRHGLPPGAGDALVPLVERALAARPSVARAMLRLVEDLLTRQAGVARAVAAADLEGEAADERLLGVVARLLHRWDADAV